MISKTEQNWTSGSVIKVGFMTLRVIEARPTPGDYLPDLYVLKSLSGRDRYEFVPHHGLTKISSRPAIWDGKRVGAGFRLRGE